MASLNPSSSSNTPDSAPPKLKYTYELLKDLGIYSIELPGVSVRHIDITLERYNTLWYQLYVHVAKESKSPLSGKHYITCLTSEYIDGIRSSYLNGILRITVDNPYKEPIRIPILRLVD